MDVLSCAADLRGLQHQEPPMGLSIIWYFHVLGVQRQAQGFRRAPQLCQVQQATTSQLAKGKLNSLSTRKGNDVYAIAHSLLHCRQLTLEMASFGFNAAMQRWPLDFFVVFSLGGFACNHPYFVVYYYHSCTCN